MTGAVEHQAPGMALRAVQEDSPRDSPVGRWVPRWVAFVLDEAMPLKVRSQPLPSQVPAVLLAAGRGFPLRVEMEIGPGARVLQVGDPGRTPVAPSPTAGQTIPFAAGGGRTPIGLATKGVVRDALMLPVLAWRGNWLDGGRIRILPGRYSWLVLVSVRRRVG